MLAADTILSPVKDDSDSTLMPEQTEHLSNLHALARAVQKHSGVASLFNETAVQSRGSVEIHGSGKRLVSSRFGLQPSPAPISAMTVTRPCCEEQAQQRAG